MKFQQMTQIKDYTKKITDFFSKHIWDPDFQGGKRYRILGLRTVRVLYLSVKSYMDDQLAVRASALTYFTMLSIVPVLALGFGIAKGFGLEAILEDLIKNNLSGQEEVADYILEFTKSMVNTAKGGLVAGIGLGVLLWSVFRLLMNIENAFNVIWDVKAPRTYLRKFTDYFSLMLFAPIMIILSSSATVFVTTQLSSLSDQSNMMDFVSPAFVMIVQTIPYAIMWTLFSLLFMVMPNIKVNPGPAIVAGIVTGTMFQWFQGVYIFAQSFMSGYNAIYGSFAALPLFLIWLQTSWLIVLFGGELSYAIQHEHLKGTAARNENVSMRSKKKFALRLMHVIIDRFSIGDGALTAKELAGKISAPLSLVEQLLEVLTEKRLLVKVLAKKGQTAFSPAKTINNIQVNQIIDAIETFGATPVGLVKDESLKSHFDDFDAILEKDFAKSSALLMKNVSGSSKD